MTDKMPDEIWAVRWGDDEPMNGNWVDCSDPMVVDTKYLRAALITEKLEAAEKMAKSVERFIKALEDCGFGMTSDTAFPGEYDTVVHDLKKWQRANEVTK